MTKTEESSLAPAAAAFLQKVNAKDSLDEGDPSNQQTPEQVHLVFERDVAEVNSKEKFRVDYLRRLTDQKVWIPQEHRAPKHQSLIIFDWDDTLMYSTFLAHGTMRSVTRSTKQHLESIEKRACDLLNTALGLGQTFIITNATEGWVEECVARYMPSLKEIVEKVKVISARSTQEMFCNRIADWKTRAFLELGNHLDKQMITNLVSVGDSNFEMEAVRVLGEQFSNSLIKTVKLQESPSPEELMKELDLLAPKFQRIVEKATNMKIRLERRTS